MARVSIEDCLKKIENRFVLVLLAAKRARLLMDGVEPLIATKNKFAVAALREVAMGKINAAGFDLETCQPIETVQKKDPAPEVTAPPRPMPIL